MSEPVESTSCAVESSKYSEPEPGVGDGVAEPIEPEPPDGSGDGDAMEPEPRDVSGTKLGWADALGDGFAESMQPTNSKPTIKTAANAKKADFMTSPPKKRQSPHPSCRRHLLQPPSGAVRMQKCRPWQPETRQGNR